MAHATSRFALLIALAMLASACATTSAMRAGERAEGLQDYDRAIVEYTKVVREDPDNQNARQALDRMKLRASLEHLTRGRRLHASGRLDEALIELQIASELNPSNPDVEELLTAVRTQLRTRVATAREGKTELETLIERSRSMTPEGLELPSDVRLPATLTFRPGESSRVIYTALAKLANVNLVFDPQFRDQAVTIDLAPNASFESALQSLSSATRNFYRVTSQRTVTVIPDTPAKRLEYEEEVVQTFFLSNADVKEVTDLLRIVVDARRLAPVPGANAISIKDTPERIAAAARLISAIDKARPEVVIDVELLEVDRQRFKEYGLQLASPESPGISGEATIGGDVTLRDLRSLSQSDILLTNLPGLFYRLLKTDTNTRTLASPQLRASEGMAAQARFGERVPVPATQFAPIATGGLNQQPITSFNYENIGVNIDITPRTHHNDEVSLAVRVEVSSLSPNAGFGGLPIFGNRSINTVIRLRDGETNLLAGLIRDDERQVLAGVPGLSDLPIIGRLFAHNRRETQETDIVLTLTPRIVRVLDLTEDDLRPFRVRGDGDIPPLDLPVPPELPQQPAAEPPPQPAPQLPVGPILPPPLPPTER